MEKVILGNNLKIVEALQKAGILPDHCRRILIDIPCDTMVSVYYACLGDKSLDETMAMSIEDMLEETIKKVTEEKNEEEMQK